MCSKRKGERNSSGIQKGLKDPKLSEYLLMMTKDKLGEIEEVALIFEETSRMYTQDSVHAGPQMQHCNTSGHMQSQFRAMNLTSDPQTQQGYNGNNQNLQRNENFAQYGPKQ